MNIIRITTTRCFLGRHWLRLDVVAGPHAGRHFWVRSGTRGQINRQITRRLRNSTTWRWA